jgi:hypothetical protein
MHRILLSLLIVMLVAVHAMADTLTIGRKEHSGEFLGFKNNKFEFKADGKVMKENRTKVKKLELEKPVKVTYEKRGKKPVAGVMLLRYEKFKFVFKEKDKEKEKAILGNSIKMVEKAFDWGGGGGGIPGMKRPTVLEPIDFQGLDNAELTPEQQTALAAYKTARAAYDKYIDASSAMVAKMDASMGKSREEYMNDLRLRKQDEQPLKNALQRATNDALAVFPDN